MLKFVSRNIYTYILRTYIIKRTTKLQNIEHRQIAIKEQNEIIWSITFYETLM